MTTATTTIPSNSHHGNQLVMLNMDVVMDQDTHDPPPSFPRDNVEDGTVDTALIAHSVGSVVNPRKNAFLRSFTLHTCNYTGEDSCASDYRWEITFADPISARNISSPSISSSSSSWRSTKMIQKFTRNKSKSSVTIASVEGHAKLSQIEVGDIVTKINGKKIGPSYNAQRCSDIVNRICSESNRGNGILSIQTGNEYGVDTVLEATVLKPHPGATCKELGLDVWWWRGLCVRSVAPGSLFEHSGLKIDDMLESINGISLTFQDKVTADDFDRIVQELPREVTIVVKRTKHRYSAQYE